MQAAKSHDGPVVLITLDTRSAQQMEQELRFYAAGSDLPILPFPDWECLPYDAFSPYQEIISQRLLTLYRLPELKQGIIVAPLSAVMLRTAPAEFIAAHTFIIRSGERLDIDSLRQQLAAASYDHVNQVMEPGEFAVRGGIIDLFPAGSEQPYRIDLFGDEVDSIRSFDPETQLSTSKVEEIRLLPAREYETTDAAIKRFRQNFRQRFEGDPQASALYSQISKGNLPGGLEFYIPLFMENTATLFDYTPANTLLVTEKGLEPAAADWFSDASERYDMARLDPDRPALPPQELFLQASELHDYIAPHARVSMDVFQDAAQGGKRTFPVGAPPLISIQDRHEKPYAPLVNYVQGFDGRVLLVAESPGRREVLQQVLGDNGLHPAPVADWKTFVDTDTGFGITMARMDNGLLLDQPAISVITEKQLYGEKVMQRRRRGRKTRDSDAMIRSLAELKIGDPVVHEEHGVGRYLGLTTMTVGDIEGEYLTLEYRDGDKLYVPVLSLHLISRYVGAHPDSAPLHKLGGELWARAKRKARQKAHDAAAELLEIHARRTARRGHAFSARDDAYAEFAARFPFEETPDQEKVIEDVLNDMESDRPMDRLVCGDVGFGKTEVALRAAFLAAYDGKQVIVLAPTTLLAGQHYQNFLDRFADLPFRIELLSRFQSKKEARATLDGLAAGKVDIVIGTHRLLQKDVKLKNPGLIIIDEEHRFGVRHKEALKKLRSEVDILTLTATPIPRSLNMALSGLRDISIIGTPPQGRLAVKTFVTEWRDSLLREAIVRELRRGGQVYFLHNDVKTMDNMAERLQQLVPQAEIRSAHGQMRERELERVMQDFYHQRFNVLVCSTIIESGIDIPSANTMLINRADKFGLAQLHQLRGRVGRSHHLAYAYLITPPVKGLTADARKRLQAIESLESLGVGFTLATHDLEIRGAGEILGENQSGQVDEVGFALYSDLLNRAIKSMNKGEELQLDEEPDSDGVEINLHFPALIPADYISDVHTRLILYKRISAAHSEEELTDIKVELVDRFGSLPDEADALLRISALQLKARPFDIRKIEVGPKGGRVTFRPNANIDPMKIINLIQLQPKHYALDGPEKLLLKGDFVENENRIQAVWRLLGELGAGISA